MAAYVTIFDSRRFVRSDSPDTTFLLPVSAGGSNADLSATGGANRFAKQSSVGGAFSVGLIGAGDVPDAALTSNAALLNRNSQSFTGTPQLFADGSAAAPSIALASSPTTGLFRAGADILGFANAGVERARIASNGTLTFTGAAATTIAHSFTGSTTGQHYLRFTNTSGDMAIGIDNSTGTTSGTNYAAFLDVIANLPLKLMTNNTVRIIAPAAGGLVIGTAALGTTATDGFLYIPTCAGIPTGVPTTQTGTVAIIYDSTNNNFYAYNTAWKKVALA